MTIHFHSSDERFCKSNETRRRFTFEPCDVTCADCKANDRFELSESGKQALRDLGYMDAQGNVS